jgi:uncharacterized membrane protein YqgA involved in biofilm formation
MFSLPVIINTAAVIAGSLLGVLTGRGISARFRNVLFQAIGLLTIGLGVKMFFDAKSALIVLASMAAGGILGEALKIEDWLAGLADKVGPGQGANFARGFVVALVLFVPGPMTMIGSLRVGLEGNGELLLVKSLMDFISSIMLAAAYGWGVLLSAAGVWLIEGLLVAFAGSLAFLQQPRYLGDFTGVGGLLLLAIGVRMLELREIKVGNYLPALIIAPILSAIFG